MSSNVLFSFCDSLTFLKMYPDMCGENYSPEVRDEIKNNAIAWLNRLPMVEYAHVLVTTCAHHLGGDQNKYIDVLYNMLLQPILSRYYRELEKYRFNRYLVMNHPWDQAHITPKTNSTALKRQMGYCTCRTRRALRAICEQYRYLKELSNNDPKVRYWVTGVNQIADKLDSVEWDEALAKISKEALERDFELDIVKISDPATATNVIIRDKINELCSIYEIAKVTTTDPYFDELRLKLNALITHVNLETMDGTNSYKKLAEKVNELISTINNQKTRKT